MLERLKKYKHLIYKKKCYENVLNFIKSTTYVYYQY